MVETSNRESLRQFIQAEIEDWKRNLPEDGAWQDNLGHFFVNLPNDDFEAFLNEYNETNSTEKDWIEWSDKVISIISKKVSK